MGQPPDRRPQGLTADELRGQRRTILVTVAAAALVTSLAPLATVVSGGRIEAAQLLSDPAELTGAPWYLGAVSWVNLLVWGAAAALHLVAATALRRHEPGLAAALAWLGALTLLFALDDLFLVHEIVVPWLLGLPQAAVFAGYAAVLAGLAVRFHGPLLAQPDVGVLLLALVALGLSVVLDLFGWDVTARRVAEEGFKLLGALAWMLFPGKVLVRAVARSAPPTQPG